jgi:cell wall-associated NlpC family hydrolase
MAIKGPEAVALAAGAVAVYLGVTGKSIKTSIQYLLSGKSLADVPADSALAINVQTGSSTSASSSASGQVGIGTPTGVAIANDALRYAGHAYLYGGASGPDGGSPWDCSSFVSYVLGHDMGLAIPGGSWAAQTNNGNSHGPSTLSYLVWSGCSTISKANAEAGDLVVWPTHMGIMINNTSMISALNESLGTMVTTAAGGAPTGEISIYRRLNAASLPGGTASASGSLNIAP